MAEASIEYVLSTNGRSCEGWSYGQDFAEHVRTRVRSRCADYAGTRDLVERVQGKKGLDPALLNEILAAETPGEPWRTGECVAECFLEDQKGASLPNPRRDKNPKASAAGADLVGVSREKGGTVFLFGEVKTTSSNRSPPPVMNHMVSQLEKISSHEPYQRSLIRWLAFRAYKSDLWDEFLAAACSYAEGRCRMVGVLIRDTEPKRADIASACSKIKKSGMLLALYALYMPVSIEQASEIAAGVSDG